jgi:molybdate/tungstate transport system ATP-binding protein
MLECSGVSAQVGSFRLHDISLTIPTGAHAVLIGPTASGKTTLLELIAGAIVPTSGDVIVNDVHVTDLPPERRGVGLVPQHGYLFPHLNVRRNIAYGARDVRAISDVARRFGIHDLLDRSVVSLSGGERQLVALCRALAAQPAILLLDEPLSALDRQRREQALREFGELQRERAICVLHVTHEESDTKFATVRFEMRDGCATLASL